MLYLVPTPIGNLSDMTFRAVQVLKEVDLILAEDTRTASVLLKHYEIRTPLRSFHKFNEHQALSKIVEMLETESNIALISDAGTPGISDPGFLLVRACVEKEIKAECLPGATAVIPAVVESGFPCDKFVFEGFLPMKKGRQTRLKFLSTESRTIVLYESPHRIIKLLQELEIHFSPERQISLSREISKIYAETLRGTVREVLRELQARNQIKGEIVLVISGADKNGDRE